MRIELHDCDTQRQNYEPLQKVLEKLCFTELQIIGGPEPPQRATLTPPLSGHGQTVRLVSLTAAMFEEIVPYIQRVESESAFVLVANKKVDLGCLYRINELRLGWLDIIGAEEVIDSRMTTDATAPSVRNLRIVGIPQTSLKAAASFSPGATATLPAPAAPEAKRCQVEQALVYVAESPSDLEAGIDMIVRWLGSCQLVPQTLSVYLPASSAVPQRIRLCTAYLAPEFTMIKIFTLEAGDALPDATGQVPSQGCVELELQNFSSNIENTSLGNAVFATANYDDQPSKVAGHGEKRSPRLG